MPDTITLGLIAGAFIGSTAGYLGSIMLSKHMALVGDALSHVALPGLDNNLNLPLTFPTIC